MFTINNLLHYGRTLWTVPNQFAHFCSLVVDFCFPLFVVFCGIRVFQFLLLLLFIFKTNKTTHIGLTFEFWCRLHSTRFEKVDRQTGVFRKTLVGSAKASTDKKFAYGKWLAKPLSVWEFSAGRRRRTTIASTGCLLTLLTNCKKSSS